MRVFREFPQYGGRQLEPEYSGSNGCYIAFTTEDAAERVATYYREQLTAGGWKLDPPPPSVEAAEGQTEGGGVSAARGRYGYMTLLEAPTRNGRPSWCTSSRGRISPGGCVTPVFGTAFFCRVLGFCAVGAPPATAGAPAFSSLRISELKLGGAESPISDAGQPGGAAAATEAMLRTGRARR